MKAPQVPTCYNNGSPEWWTDYSGFICELDEGHEGPHRQTIEWTDPFAIPVQGTDGDMLRWRP